MDGQRLLLIAEQMTLLARNATIPPIEWYDGEVPPPADPPEQLPDDEPEFVIFLLPYTARVGYQFRGPGGPDLNRVRLGAQILLEQARADRDERLPAAGGGRSVGEVEVLVEAAMATPDGQWRVEVVRRRGERTRWYRVVHVDGEGDDDAVLDWLSIAAVERVLAEAGIDMASLVPVVDAVVEGRDAGPAAAHGAA